MSERMVTVTVELPEGQARDFARRAWVSSAVSLVADAVRDALAALPPVMDEPTYPGAVVMTDGGLASRSERNVSFGGGPLWVLHTPRGGIFFSFDGLTNPRPLTPAERRDLGMPALLPDGYVAVKRPMYGDATEISAAVLRWWARETYRMKRARVDEHPPALVLEAVADALEAEYQA